MWWLRWSECWLSCVLCWLVGMLIWICLVCLLFEFIDGGFFD